MSDFLIARWILVTISIIFISLLIKARINNRVGNQFFIIMIIFWSSILIISSRPEILDSVLDTTGLVNRAQFLFSVSLLIIGYLLYNQVLKNRTAVTNLNRIIRKVALANFAQQIKNSENTQVVIILVAKDESATIGSVIDNIKSQNISESYKILVVNDGSEDDTEKIAKEKGALVVNHFYNLGIGAANKTGYLACQKLNPKFVINIDSDGQHDPKYIPQIISKLKNDDLVYGSRFSKQSYYQTSIIRKIGNRFYTNLVNKISRINLTDVTSGYRGIKFERIKSIFFVSEKNFAIELALRAAKNKLKISEISTEAIPRKTGKSQFYKVERFLIYNINVLIQIYNAFSKNPQFNNN